MNSVTETMFRKLSTGLLIITGSTVITSAQQPECSPATNPLARNYIEPPALGVGVIIRNFGQAMSYSDGRLLVANNDSGLTLIYQQTAAPARRPALASGTNAPSSSKSRSKASASSRPIPRHISLSTEVST